MKFFVEGYITDLFNSIRDGVPLPKKEGYVYQSADEVDFIGSNTLLGNVEGNLATEMCRETFLKRILEPLNNCPEIQQKENITVQ